MMIEHFWYLINRLLTAVICMWSNLFDTWSMILASVIFMLSIILWPDQFFLLWSYKYKQWNQVIVTVGVIVDLFCRNLGNHSNHSWHYPCHRHLFVMNTDPHPFVERVLQWKLTFNGHPVDKPLMLTVLITVIEWSYKWSEWSSRFTGPKILVQQYFIAPAMYNIGMDISVTG